MKTKTKRTEVAENNDTPDTFMEDMKQFKLTKEEILAAAGMGRNEAMAMVGFYYTSQKLRIGAGNKISAHERNTDLLHSDGEIHLAKLKDGQSFIEKQAARSLQAFAENSLLGRWCMSNAGVGPIITAGMLAHIDISKAPTAGAIWRFAGLDPTIKWEKGQKRPYNAALKTLMWKLGEGFKKCSISGEKMALTPKEVAKLPEDDRNTLLKRKKKLEEPTSLYVRLYMERKALEKARNDKGVFADQAAQILSEARMKGRRISPLQKETWSEGRLQDKGLDLRAMRYAVKIFLSHFHFIGSHILYGKAPEPWVIAHGGHVHFIPPPNWPMKDE